MNDGRLMRIGAMLAVLVVLAGVFAASPYWNARADNKTIWGIVSECGVQGVFLGGVRVTLIDAHGLRDNETTTTDGAGHYSFAPPTGSYIAKFTLAEHYNNDTGVLPFRFDGSVHVEKDVCLRKMPVRTSTLSVLVVNQVTSGWLHEGLTSRFPRAQINNENIACGVDTVTWAATVSHRPVVKPLYALTWGGRLLAEGSDFRWDDPFTGNLTVLDTTIRTSLATTGCLGKWLNVTYQYSGTWARLLHYPVVAGSYTVYKNNSAWGPGADWSLDIDTGVFTILRNFNFGPDFVDVSYSSTAAVAGASVVLYDSTVKQEVARGTTNSTGADPGHVLLSIWGASFSLQVSKDQYEPYEATIDTSAVNKTRVTLPNAILVFGHAYTRTADGVQVVKANVVGYLYNKDPTVSPFRKVISANVTSSLYIFYAERNQAYKMVIDADGYTAAEADVATGIVNPPAQDVFLVPSLKEEYRTDVLYGVAGDWNNITIGRHFTLRPDTTVPGLELPGIRSLGLQVDYTLGNKNGIEWDLGEPAAFQTWLQGRLQDYITTDGFLTTNGQPHNSTGPYPLPSVTRVPLVNPTAIYVNTTATYKLSTTPLIQPGKSTYYVNITSPDDSNTTVYQNQVIDVHLPRGYEMTQKKITGSITTTGWTTVTVDPGLAPPITSRIDMTVRKSLNGTARAMVENPPGKFHVLDNTLANYTAVVAANAKIVFSANQSTDPVTENIKDANFTWNFTKNIPTSPIGYGIWSTFNYSAAVLTQKNSHYFVVNLTVTETGGNKTYREIYVYVDDTPPIAVIKTNRTGTGGVNGSKLLVDEDIPIRFDGSLSTDIAYPGAPINSKDQIPDTEGNRGYKWDFNGDHTVDSFLRVSVKPYEKPGRYNATLQVVDWVGNKAQVNATLTVYANDTTKPTPNWVILDPSNNWGVTTSLVEDKEYAFNASSSSDNYEENKNLSFRWTFPGPVVCANCTDGHNTSWTRGRDGWNVTVKWTEFNLSYNVTLNVTDTGFRDPSMTQKPNWANRTASVPVSVDVKQHPDLRYVAASLKIEPGQPEEGQQINVSFMVDNDKNRANATNVRVRLTAKDPNGAVVLTREDPQWFDEQWRPLTDRQIDTGKKVRFVFVIRFPQQGNKSIEIRFNDTLEPYTWVDGQNRATGSVFVKLAGWVIPAAFVGIIALVIGVALGLRAYSRYKSGELVFRRKEKKEGKKEKKKLEEKEPEEEAEEEDAKGKKRL